MTKSPRKPAGLPDRDALIRFLREAGEAEKADIARAFGLKGAERRQLRDMLRDLESEGALGKRGRKGYAEAGVLPPVGVADVVEKDADGELYVRLVKEGGDAPRALLLPDKKGETGPAPGIGDRLLVKFARDGDGWTARVVKTLGQSAHRVLGVVRKGHRETRIEPVDRRSKDVLVISKLEAEPLRDGDLVLAAIQPGVHRYGPKPGKVLEIVGREEDPRAASLLAIHAHGVPTGFSEAVDAEAEAQDLPTLKGREDLRDIPFITIDPMDARDHDDAVFASRDEDANNPGGWVVWVAIADVAAYVRPGTQLDKEARAKGNSTYFPDRVEPMLPERLSNGLCSLKQGENRACLAVRMVFDKDGRKKGHRFVRGLMRSHAKLAYEQAQAAIDGTATGEAADLTGPIMDTILYPIWNAYAAMLKGRERRSPLAIETMERRIRFGPDGQISSIEPRQSLQAHRLIEEYMIQANVAAAETLEQKKTPLIYRVHDTPSQEKMFNLADFLATLAMPWNKGEPPTTKRFNKLLDQTRDTPHAEVVNEVVLRSQMQAIYTPENVGHFGLNLDRYAHFTSPIRRYADLIVHRGLIRALKLGPDHDGGGLTDREIAELPAIAEHVVMTERRSMAAERDATDRYVAAFLEERVGATFQGRITGVTRFGLFVRLEETGADGLVPVSKLGDEYFHHDDRLHALIGERSGKRWTLGRTVEVKLVEATPITGGLLFEMLSDPAPRDPNAPEPRYGQRARSPGGNGYPKRGANRPGGPKPRNGGKPSGGLKGVRKGKRK